ncbi:uncharacterized protein LOC142608764 [Castanea sativa]|uniref:uncharacterized protein LOC142608764 n=1 Tax=Castanea sativa TaxID=21020 RepID=UPI003F649DD9
MEGNNQLAKRMRFSATPVLGFSEEDKEGTYQPHDDALVVTICIGGYDVKRVLVDDGSGAEIMYPDLFNGLKLKEEDLEKYDSPLVGFDGKQKPARGIDVDDNGGSAEELDKIFIGEGKEKYFQVGSQLPIPEREELVKFLKDNIDVFAWTAYDVPGIDPEFICHHLNVSPNAKPRKQPPRCAFQEHAEAVKEEVNKLKQAGAIKEIYYPEWLANTVVEKTTFRAPNGNYHYRVMPFGLKNAGSTYQRMVTRMFELQLGRNMEAYIDGMVVKSKEVGDHLRDLHKTFSVLRRYKLRLNTSKCSFGVSSGKFLEYMITHQGIEVNPDQIKAILGLHPPRNPKEVQKLTGMFAALNWLISRSADRCRPFYRLLHKWKDFQWTDECNLAFKDLKQYLANLPILSRPKKEEVLYAYLAVTDYAVSLVLVRNDDGVQKLAIMRRSDYTNCVAKWGTKLGAYDVKYMPRTAIKGQVLADFVVEFMESGIKQEDVMLAVMSIGLGNVLLWEVYTNGASNRKGAEIGIVLITPEKLVMEKSLRLGFVATNNEAEYEALLASAQMVRHLGGEVVELYCDSRLVVGQVNGEFEARDERMKKYLERVKDVLGLFKSFKV